MPKPKQHEPNPEPNPWLLREALAALEEARIVIQLQNHGSCLSSVEDAIEMIEREIY